MRYCEKCRVKVRGEETRCPLCQNRLTGSAEENVYPSIPTVYKQNELFFKSLIFSTITAGVVCAAINLILPQSGYWSVFVLLGILCFWISLSYALRKKDNIPKSISNQVFILSILSVGWDWFTGWHGWSVNYVLPISFSVALLSLAIIAKVIKLPAEDYIVNLVVDIVFGIAPLILYIAGLVGPVIPSVICTSLSIISLSALILIEGKRVLREIIKNFHL
ncbi:MAG: DUF6320 domain-containing protein [Sporolactobacillus sp.]